MSNQLDHGGAYPSPDQPEPTTRPVGGTEYSWCRAVPAGTGITVLVLLLSKPPEIRILQNALHKLQSSHPILRSKLHFDAVANTFSFVASPSPYLQIQQFDLASTADIVTSAAADGIEKFSISKHQLVIEHEMNKNPWATDPNADAELFFVSSYALSETRWVLALRLHTGACDRSSAVALLAELLELVGGGKEIEVGSGSGSGLGLGIEECIPSGKANKPFWARGKDMLGYSLNALRTANLEFVDAAGSPRCSRLVRLMLSSDHTAKLVAACNARNIKLCAALAAAAMIAARSTKDLPDQLQREKYSIATLLDCRSILDPVLSTHHLGFYHSAITNSHDVNMEDKLWELAERCYKSYADAKKNNKHFSDMSDLNFLMVKAVENPGLTPSSAQRTALVSVFENALIDDTNDLHSLLGIEDFVGCASIHSVGPSLAIFDTIRNGELDCACVYPSPLHSREQMHKFVDDIKRILVDSL
ncbi:unnamed protein product [Linum tenue]|uniref:Uncharacterized protein n=2 Tax=Linum tenue TaxID=586396 RepID=A0AAV0I3Y3_9ROSI|nr:unnamed protein product [Linum tenue]